MHSDSNPYPRQKNFKNDFYYNFNYIMNIIKKQKKKYSHQESNSTKTKFLLETNTETSFKAGRNCDTTLHLQTIEEK